MITKEKINQSLIEFAQKGNVHYVKYLVEAEGADVGFKNYEALVESSSRGHLVVTKYLLSKGAKITAQDQMAILIAVKLQQMPTIQYFFETPEVFNNINLALNDHMLVKAASKDSNNLEMTQYLISQGADVNAARANAAPNILHWLDLYELNIKLRNHLPDLSNKKPANKL